MKKAELIDFEEVFEKKRVFWIVDDEGNRKAGLYVNIDGDREEPYLNMTITDEDGEDIELFYNGEFDPRCQFDRFIVEALGRSKEVSHV